MKRRKIFAVLLMTAVLLTGLGGTIVASAADAKISLPKGTSPYVDLNPGATQHFTIPFTTSFNYINNPFVAVELEGKEPFMAGDVTITRDEGIANTTDFLATGSVNYMQFDITTKDSAKIGTYKANVVFTYMGVDPDTYLQKEMKTSVELTFRITKEKAPVQLVLDSVEYDKDAVAVGNTFDLTVGVKNEGELEALNTFIELDLGTDKVLVPNYTIPEVKVGDLKAGESKKVTFSIQVNPKAEEGLKTVDAKLTCKNDAGEAIEATRSIYINILKMSTGTSEDAKLTVGSNQTNQEVLAGTNTDISIDIENIGAETAKNIKVSITGGIGKETGIVPKFKGENISVKDLAKKKKTTVKIPLEVIKSAPAGLTELTVQVSYDDSQGVSRTVVGKAYLTINAIKEEETTNEVTIDNVFQSPASPSVGDKVSVTFEIQNKGNKDITNLQLMGEELSSSGFESTTSEPYYSVGVLKSGAKRKITMVFKVGAGIPEGMNKLTIAYTYVDAKGAAQKSSIPIYILNVINDSNSKPKLIIDEFSTDKEELRAGSTFVFSFSLKNTHTSKAAKNIKVTITQKDNNFTATKSNSFYIERIGAGETYKGTMDMKVKSDAATGSYDVDIAVEYEYDDMSKVDMEAGGVKEISPVKLQATENARPVVENISIGNYGTPTINQSTNLSFQFYNMGKSPLANVYFTIEGDYILEGGSMSYLGTVTAGSSEFVEPMVIPQIEGTAKGKLVVHFENSNGEEVTVEKELPEVFVQGEMQIPEGGFDPVNPGEDLPIFNPDEETSKEPILKTWVFIVIQAAIVIIFIPVTRGVIVSMKKRSLRKQERNNNE